MRGVLPFLLLVLLGTAAGCGKGDRISTLEERLEELEAENALLRGETGEELDSLDGLAEEDLALLTSLPQERAEAPPEGAELEGLDIWASPPPEPEPAPVIAEPEPPPPESPPIALPEPPPREDEQVSSVEPDGSGGAGEAVETETGDDDGEEPVDRVEDGIAAGGPADDDDVDLASGEPPMAIPRLAVHRAVLGTDVVDREPVGVATRFPRAAGKVYCFTEVSILAPGGPTRLVHRWTLDGLPQGETELRIAGDRWRTFSNRTVTEKPGRWMVQLIDEQGIVLESLEFTVE